MPVNLDKINETKLNAAAKLLLDQLPDNCGELVYDIQKDYQLPLWHLLCGILLSMHQEGRLSAFTVDPSWKEGFRQESLQCQQCNKIFKPINIGQLFCSNDCGEQHELTKRILQGQAATKERAKHDKEILENARKLIPDFKTPEPELISDITTDPNTKPSDWAEASTLLSEAQGEY